MKKILLLLILLVVAFFAYQKFMDRIEEDLEEGKGVAYVTSDMKLNRHGRDFSLKAVIEFPSQKACEASYQGNKSFVQDIQELCTATPGCKSSSTSACIASVDEKYKSMLDTNNTSVYYLYAESERKQRAILVYWGLNDQEARKVCEAGKMQILRRRPDDKIGCIEPH